MSFCSFVAIIDSRALDKVLPLDFSLCLSENLFSTLDSALITNTNPFLGTTQSKLEKDISFKLGGYSDIIISQMGIDEMRPHLFDARNFL